MSGHQSAPQTPKSSPVSTLRLQTSSKGRPIPLIYGKTRLTLNLLDYVDFTAIEHDTTTSGGGKGGGGGGDTTTTSYTYTAGVIMAIGRGQVNGVTTIWKNKDVFSSGSGIGTAIRFEYHVVPGSPYQITADRASAFVSDAGAYVETGGVQGRAPLSLGVDYTVSAGVYTFASSFSGKAVFLSYNVSGVVLDVSGQAGLTLTPGSASQSALGWMTTGHPSNALAYRYIAYLSAPSYSLGDTADLPNHSVEVDTQTAYSSTIRDANPKDVVADLLSNPIDGGGFPGSQIGDMTTFSKYCVANNIFVSPAYIEQEGLRSILERMMKITNTGIYYSGAQLKFVPYGDVSATANGVTYTPNLTPVYDLTDDDFIGDSGSDPIKITRKPPSSAYNSVQVKYYNRSNNYNEDVIEAKDQASIELYGLRAMDVLELKEICDPTAARNVAQIILQRVLYIRNQYEFRLGWSKCLLEPMDLVTLTDSGLGMNQVPARIISVEEDEEGTLTITAEEFPLNVCNAATYSTQAALGYSANYNVSAGNCLTPIMFEPPIELALSSDYVDLWIATGGGTNYGGCEVWASLDNATFQRVTTINGNSRYGTTTSTLSSQVSPGVSGTQTVGISLLAGGQMLSGTLNDALVNNTLCYVGGEFMSYQTATLTGTNAYNLTTLNRGAYGSGQPSHASGQDFVRVDNNIGKIALSKDYIGKTVYIKLLSFNTVGGGMQDLASVSSYSFAVTGRFAKLPPDDIASLTVSVKADGTRNFSWPALTALDVQNGGGYRIKYRTAGSGTAWASMTTLADGLITEDPFQSNNPQAGTYDFAIAAVDKLGNESTNPRFVTNAVLTNEPVTYGSAINMLANSDWIIDTGTNSGASAFYQWNTTSTISGGSTFSRNGTYNLGRGGASWTDTGSIGTTNSTDVYQSVPVVAGNTYEFSAYHNTFNATSFLIVQWYDNTNTAISSTTIDTNTAAGVTNPKLSDYAFLWGTATAPAGAVTALVKMRKRATNSGQTSSTIYVQRAFMCLARTGVTEQTATPWIEAGTDNMHGGGIEPLTVGTSQIAANAATDVISTTASNVTVTYNTATETTICSLVYTAIVTGTVVVTLTGQVTNAGHTVGGGGGPYVFVGSGIRVLNATSSVSSQSIRVPNENTVTLNGQSSAGNFTISTPFSVTAGTTYTFNALIYNRYNGSDTTVNNAEMRLEALKK